MRRTSVAIAVGAVVGFGIEAVEESHGRQPCGASSSAKMRR